MGIFWTANCNGGSTYTHGETAPVYTNPSSKVLSDGAFLVGRLHKNRGFLANGAWLLRLRRRLHGRSGREYRGTLGRRSSTGTHEAVVTSRIPAARSSISAAQGRMR
jgi:hypothetical protein